MRKQLKKSAKEQNPYLKPSSNESRCVACAIPFTLASIFVGRTSATLYRALTPSLPRGHGAIHRARL